MTRRKKIDLFFLLLILNHILHTYEVYTVGYRSGVPLIFSDPIWFFVLQSVILIMMIFLFVQLIRRPKWSLPIIRIISWIFLLYGSILAFGNIYKEERIVGSFTGFFFVMISLPLILWISDDLKVE